MVAHRVVYVTILALGVLVLGAIGSRAECAGLVASAFGVRVVLPGGDGEPRAASPRLRAEAPAQRLELRRRRRLSRPGSARRQDERRPAPPTASGSATVQSVSLFGGEITADGRLRPARPRTRSGGAQAGRSTPRRSRTSSPSASRSGPPRQHPRRAGRLGLRRHAREGGRPQRRRRLGFRGFVDRAPRRPHRRARRPARRHGDHDRLRRGGGERAARPRPACPRRRRQPETSPRMEPPRGPSHAGRCRRRPCRTRRPTSSPS